MVSVSLRQNGGGVPERNSFERGSDETVYVPIVLTPGRTPEDWVETRTREAGHDRWPHPENPGLIPDAGGYFDWAGRLLYLPDGSPNPEVSGAYRYQTRPDLCDPHEPDSEPESPRYEPMWLRHKPGDTWMIGGKPFAPDDPGPYGNPRWRPDRRTGRHRRGERPDPIPPWEWQEGDPEPPDFAATGIRWDAHGDWTPDRIAASGKPRDGAGTIPERPVFEPDDSGWISGSCKTKPGPGTDAPSVDRTDPDWAFIHRYTNQTDTAPAEPDEESANEPPQPHSAQRNPSPRAARPAPRRPRFWNDDSRERERNTEPTRERDPWRATEPSPLDEPNRFSGLRERAWSDFLTDSQPLYDEHLQPPVPDVRERVTWFLRCLLWVLTIGLTAAPRPPAPARAPTRPATDQPTRIIARCAVPALPSPRTPPEALRFDLAPPRLPRLSFHTSGTAAA